MQIKVLLNEELSKKFEQIKTYYGLETTTEAVRFCIQKEYRRVFLKENNETEKEK